ncbi:BON domain-containing protein [Burkholderia pseudomallei]|uniref:BON domain-containing protein n=1 Tax=Burkholderia pseudomallei TaxID=28450 RepID=UPI001A9F2B0D|nr:BON domain-containing protein [Burkholderia pseudomallei]QTB53407.1 BON domain-containing protein [Burkholderia pseudomallei]
MIVKRGTATILIGLSLTHAAYALGPSDVNAEGSDSQSSASSIPGRHVATDVRRALGNAIGMNVSRMSVTARSGTVTLSGSATDQQQIDRATQLAASIDGVKDVVNNLVIRVSGTGS